MTMRFRLAHRIYAALCGYFWLPCPLCGQEFGGHEWRDRIDLSSSIRTDEWHRRIGICPACTLDGRGDPRHGVRQRFPTEEMP